MSRGVNKVILVGNVGQDPEVRYMPNGNAVANVSLATSESWKDKNTGEQQERTEWHRCAFFGRLAEVVAEYVKKGSKIYCEGKLQTTSYEKEGQKHYSTQIVVHEMQMLDGKPDSQQSKPQGASGKDYAAAKQGHKQPPQAADSFDDDIPF